MSKENNDNLILNAVKYGAGDGGTVANLLTSSQLGVGLQAKNIDGATPLIFNPTVLVVLQTPAMYDNQPEIGMMLKTLIESHAKAVTGIDFGYTLETAEQPIGHDGQNMATPTQTKRTIVNPSFTFGEVTGNLVWNLLRTWVTDIQDPDTNISMAQIEDPGQFVMSEYAMSMLAIQYDPSGLPDRIIDTAFYTNMYPTDPGGTIGFERTIGTSKTMDRTATFTALVQHNDYIREIGKSVAAKLQLRKLNYRKLRTAAFTDVNKALSNSGLANEVSRNIPAPPAQQANNETP